jgi:SSS family solute:Na+ symporter
MIHHANVHGLIAVDWLVIGLYLAFILAQGWYYSRQQTSGGEFLVAKGRPMSSMLVGLSLFATLMSTISYLGKPGEIISKGPMVAIAQILVVPVAYVVVAYVVLPTIMRQRVTSVYEYLEARIGVVGRLLGAILFIFLRLVWMGLMTYLTSVVLAVVMGLDPKWVPALSIAVGGVAIAYSSMGGFRAVVMTDTLQATLLFAGAISAIGVIAWQTRGIGWFPTSWSPTWDTQPIFSLDPYVRITLTGSFIHMLLWRVATSCGDQTAVQRFMAVKDMRAARHMFLVNSWAVIVTTILLALVGFALLGFFTQFTQALPPEMTIDKDADKLFPYFIAHYLPPGLSGLIVTAFIAAAMSSLDSGVNAITAVISKDFLERFNRFPQAEVDRVRLMRWITLGIGVTVIALGLLVKHVPGNVYAVTNKTANLVSVPIFGLFVMAWYMPFVTPLGALIGTLCSVIVAVLVGFWDVITGREAFSFQYIGVSSIVVSLAVGALLSRYGPRREDRRGTRNWAIASVLAVAVTTTWFVAQARG